MNRVARSLVGEGTRRIDDSVYRTGRACFGITIERLRFDWVANCDSFCWLLSKRWEGGGGGGREGRERGRERTGTRKSYLTTIAVWRGRERERERTRTRTRKLYFPRIVV